MENYKEKAKAYDEALDNASVMHKAGNKDVKQILEQLFPELKESEDEKVRKALIEVVDDFTADSLWVDYNIHKEEVLTWLERQSNITKLNEEAEDDVRRRSTIQVLEYARSLDTYNQYGKADIDKNIAWLEKQDRSKNIEDSKVMLNACINVLEAVGHSHLSDWLEKQAKQKLIGKVEPKFHEGERIVHQGTGNIYQIVAIIDNQYQLKYGDNYTVQKYADVDRCARLWTIDDEYRNKATMAELVDATDLKSVDQ